MRDTNTNTELTTVQNVVVPSRGSAAAFATGSAQFGGAPVAQAPAAMPRTGTGGLLQADTAFNVTAAAAALLAAASLLLAGAPLRAAARRRHDR